MDTLKTNTFLVKRLAPVWQAMRSRLAMPQVATPTNHPGSFKVKRSGRTLTMNEYEKAENINDMEGGGNNVSIQFRLLGSFNRFSVLGESPG